MHQLLFCTKKQILSGKFGKQDSLLAMQLLLQDIADEDNSCRRCAKKVLQEAIGKEERSDNAPLQVERKSREIGHCGWLLQIAQLKNSNELVLMVIK